MRNAKLPYKIVRPLAKIALTTNFRRIYFSNAQVIPKDKPVILAANHPTAFIEPCILAVLLPRPLHFLVRGDFFKKPIFNKILRALHMVPIFRMKDGGYQKIKNNFSTFEQCFQTLSENKVIMILAEGTTVHEKRLRPLRKGAARLAFGAKEKYPDMDLRIVPVGVNYSNSDQFRSHVMIEFGEPITLDKYLEVFQNNPNKATQQLITDLRTELEKHVVIIEHKEDEALVEKLLDINRNDFPEPAQPVVSKNNYLLKRERKITDTVNNMDDKAKEDLKSAVDKYLGVLNKSKIDDYAIAIGKAPKVKSLLIIILGFLPFLIGRVFSYLPIKIADAVINAKVKAIEFRAATKISAAIVLYILYLLILLSFIVVLGKWTFLFALIALPFFGYYSIIYKEYFDKWRKLRQLEKVSDKLKQELFEKRQALLSIFGPIKNAS